MDGMSYNAKIDTNTGHFEILDTEVVVSEPEESTGPFTSSERNVLANKFFELNN